MLRSILFSLLAFTSLALVRPASALSQTRDSAVSRARDSVVGAVATRTTAGLEIDGRLDEAAWTAARPVTGFIQRDPLEGEPATEPTEVRILYDDVALYVAARLGDSRGVSRRLGRRDMELTGSDWFRVSIDAHRDRRTAYRFDVNPAGVRRDAALVGGSESEGDGLSWDGVWEAATTVDSAGWTVEYRIPFSQLSFSTADVQVWGLQLERIIDRRQETAVYAFTPKAEAGGISAYGELTGLSGIRPGRRLELLPYATARSERDPAVGLDARWRLTPALAVTGTINPDFGQVEVDPAVVNLTAFETFYDERRPFFVQGAGRFESSGIGGGFGPGASLFYSRRIGRAGAEETAILGAAKLTGRTGSGWSIGVLDALTESDGVSNYFVARASREMRAGQSAFASMLTSVVRDLEDTAAPDVRTGAWTGGVDFRHEWANRGWSVSGFVGGSHIRGSATAIAFAQQSPARYFGRPDANHLTLDRDATTLSGFAGQLGLAKQAGEHVRGAVNVSLVSPGFEVNDLGFQARADRIGVFGSARYVENTPRGRLRRWELVGYASGGMNFGGDRIDNMLAADLVLESTSYWTLLVSGSLQPERTDDRLTRGGPGARAPRGWSIGALVGSDPRRPLEATLIARHEQDAARGREEQISVRAGIRPSPGVSVSLGPSLVRRVSAAQYVGRVDDPTAVATFGARYLFAPLRYSELAMHLRMDLTFSRSLTLEIYAQPFLSAGEFATPRELARPGSYRFATFADVAREQGPDGIEYSIDPDAEGPAERFRVTDPSFTSHSLRGNAVLRWEWRPGSTLFLVWQQSRGFGRAGGSLDAGGLGDLLGSRPDNRFAVKVTYWLNPAL